MAIKLRASQLPIFLECAESAVAPTLAVEEPQEAADMGTAIHEWLADRLRGGNPDSLEIASNYGLDVKELARLCHWAWQAWLLVADWYPEPRRMETEFHIRSSGSDGSKQEGGDDKHCGSPEELPVWITGHIDLVSRIDEGEERILDFKTGRLDLDHRQQLYGYVWLVFQSDAYLQRVYAATLRTREGVLDPISETAEPGYLSRQEAEQWYERLVAHAKAGGYRPGPHCRFCRRSHECPAIGQALVQAHQVLRGALMDGTVEEIEAALPVDLLELGRVGAAIKDAAALLSSRLDRWTDALRVRVRQAGGRVPTGDGRELVLSETVRRDIVFEQAEPTLRQALTVEEIVDLVKISKTDLEDTIKAKAGRGQKGKAVAAMMDELERVGAIRETVVERLEIRRSKPGKDQ